MAVGGAFGPFVPDDTSARIAVEDPLGGVVRVGFREAEGVTFGGNLLPVIKIKGNLDQGCCSEF